MCGRFTLTTDLQKIAERFRVPASGRLEKATRRYNIAPTQDILAITNEGRRTLSLMRWGLIPSWAKDPSIGNRIINARADSLATKPAFRVALRRRRCLIPADSFYEWRKIGDSKQPVRILLRSKEPFGFAGLWDTWEAPDGVKIHSCTIITTESSELLKGIHDRMPVILPKEQEELWLDPATTNPSVTSQLLTPYPSHLMTYYEVSRSVNSPVYDAADCVTPM